MADPTPPDPSTSAAPPSSSDEDSISHTLLASVLREQAYQDITRRVTDLEARLGEERVGREAADGRYAEEHARAQQLEKANGEKALAFTETVQRVEDLQLKLELLRGEKKELQDELEQVRRKGRSDADEISKLRDRFATDSDTIRRLERERLDALSERNSFEHRYNVIAGTLEAVKRENVALSQNAVEQSAAFAKYRTKAQLEVEEISARMTTQANELTIVSRAKSRLESALHSKSQALSDLEVAHNDLSRQRDADRAAHRSSLARHEAEVGALERQLSEQAALVRALEEEYGRMERQSREAVEGARERVEAAEQGQRDAEENMRAMKQVAELLGADRAALGGAAGADSARPTFELAGASMALKNTGKTYAEIYADYLRVHLELSEARGEVKRLQTSLEDFLRQYDEKIPILQAQHQENVDLRAQADELAQQLADSDNDRTRLRVDLERAQTKLETLTTDEASLRTQVADLSVQVRVLIREVAVRDEPRLANEPFDPYEGVARSEEAGIQEVISADLVAVKDIAALQQQNMTLLKTVRQLGQRLEGRLQAGQANGAHDSEESMAVEQAIKSIEDLTEQLQLAQSQLAEANQAKEAAVREREMFGHLVMQGQAGANGASASRASSAAVLNGIQSEFSKFQSQLSHEKEALVKRLNEKDEEIHRLQDSLSRTQKALENQQHETSVLLDRQNLEQGAADDLRQQVQGLKAQIASSQRDRQQILEAGDSARQELERVKVLVTQVQTEKRMLEEMSRKQDEYLRDATQAQADLKRQLETRDLVSDSGALATQTRIKTLEDSVDRIQSEKDDLLQRMEQMKRGSLGLVPGLESQIRSLKARVEELTTEMDAKTTAHQETLAKEIAEKEEYKKGNQIGQRLKFKVEQQDKELKLLRPRVVKAEGEVSNLNTQIADIQKEKQQLESQIKELQAKAATQVDSARVRELESQLETLRSSSGEAGTLRERLNKIQSDLNAAQAALNQEKADKEQITSLLADIPPPPYALPVDPSAPTGADVPAWRTRLHALRHEILILRERAAGHSEKIRKANASITASAAGRRSAEERLAELQQQLKAKEEELAAAEAKASLAVPPSDEVKPTPQDAPIAAQAEPSTAANVSVPPETSEAAAPEPDVVKDNTAPVASPGPDAAELERLREAVKAAQGEVDRLKAELASITAERDRLREEVKTLTVSKATLEQAAQGKEAEHAQALAEAQTQMKAAVERELRTAAQVSFKDNKLKKLETALAAEKAKNTPAAEAPASTSTKPAAAPPTAAETSSAAAAPAVSIKGSAKAGQTETAAAGSSDTPPATRGGAANRAGATRGTGRGRGIRTGLRGRGGKVNNMDILATVNSVTAQNAAAGGAAAAAGTKRTADASDSGDQKRAKTESNGNSTPGDGSANS